VLAEMRAADPPVFYLVGTPKGRLSKLEKRLVTLPWQAVREGVEVKLLPQDQERYMLAQSHARIHKERAMRRRKLKWLWARLKEIVAMDLGKTLQERSREPPSAPPAATAACAISSPRSTVRPAGSCDISLELRTTSALLDEPAKPHPLRTTDANAGAPGGT
jgi:hypothetical protein